MKWFESPTFDFIKGQKIMYIVSGILFVSSIIAVLTMGLNYGIDFTGGSLVQLEFDSQPQIQDIRETLGTQGLEKSQTATLIKAGLCEDDTQIIYIKKDNKPHCFKPDEFSNFIECCTKQ